MEYAPIILGIATSLALLIAYLYSQSKIDVAQAICFTVAGCLIPPIIYALLEFKHAEHLFWWGIPFAAALALLYFQTRDSRTAWAMTLGIRGLQVWLSIMLASFIVYGSLLHYERILWYCWLAVLFGVLVGGAEILSRYQDEPWEALGSIPGLFYVSINGTIAAAAYWLVRHYEAKMFTALGGDLFLTSVIAGFGAMAVMRSKLFTFKTAGGSEIAIGPDAVITIFLQAVDRAIDRQRAAQRQSLVWETIQDIAYSSVVPNFFQGSLQAYQNLSAPEKSTLASVIKEVDASTNLKPQLKMMTLGFGFLNISGEENYRRLMIDLKVFLRIPANTVTVITPIPAVTNNAAAQAVTLFATVASPSGIVGEGTVTFTVTNDAGATIGAPVTSPAVAAGTASVSYTLPGGTSTGDYTVKAVFNATANLTSSTGTGHLTGN